MLLSIVHTELGILPILCLKLLLCAFSFIVAAYRFFKSRCEEASLERRGKAQEKRTAKRRHEQIVRVSTHAVYVLT